MIKESSGEEFFPTANFLKVLQRTLGLRFAMPRYISKRCGFGLHALHQIWKFLKKYIFIQNIGDQER